MLRQFIFVLVALPLVVACAESAASQEVRTAAAVDLDCDPSEIELNEARPRQTIASGCGKEQFYRYKCFGAKSDKKDCKWVPIANPGN